MTDQKNTLLAIVLSALVLIGWQIFFGMPQMEKQKQAQQQQTQPQPGTSPGSPAPRRRPRARRRSRGRAPPTPGTPAGRMTREAALALSPRMRDRDAAARRLDRAQGRAHRRPVADPIPRDGRPEIAADRAARPLGQPAPVLCRVRLVAAAAAPR